MPFSRAVYAARVKIELTRFPLALSSPPARSGGPLDLFVRSARSALPAVGFTARLAVVPPLLYAGALGGAALMALASGAVPAQAALAAGGSFAEFLSLAPTAGKAAMVLGGASALGILAPSGPTPRHLGSVLGGVGLLACGVGGAVAGLSLGLGMPASAGLALLAGTAGALGGYRLASAGTGLIARLPSRAPHEPTVDPRQAVSDLVNRLRVPRATILEESERQVVIGGVKVRRRQAPPPGLK